jgi:hypothetical protein
MPAPTLQIKRGNAGLAGTVPALRPGEPAISLNNFDFFIGIDTSVANNKFFGSHRYWGREDGINSLKLKLVDKDGINGIHLKTPDTVSGIGTYTLPPINTIVDGYFLRVASDGALSWSNDIDSSGATLTNTIFTGITTINGSLNVPANSNFTGIVTITNADINDGTIDGVVIGGTAPDVGYFTLVDTDGLISDFSTVGVATATDFYIDSTRVLYNDGAGITLAGIQTIDSTTKNTLETILAFDPNNFNSLNVSGIATVGGVINANGGLDVTGHTELNNLNVSGVTTFTGAVVTNGNVTLGNASNDLITINGTATFTQPIVGTISTATRATTVDTTTAPSGTFYPGLFVNNTGTASTTVYVDSGISYVSNTDTLTLTGDLAVNGGDLTSTSTSFNLVNANSTTVNAFGAATNILIGSVTGVTTIRNAETHFTGDIRINGNDIKSSDGNTNITLTSNTLTTFAGDIRVNGNDIQGSTGVTAITLSGSDATIAGDITIGGNDIKASDGTTALTLAVSTGAVTASNDLTIQGNLYVNGSTTQVNTTALSVEDRTIDLGIVNGAVPASATTWDLGILFNYNSSGAKKSAVIWEHTDSRFKFASVLGSDTNGTDANTPQLTVTTFAPIEVAELWVNNTCTGGTQQVIGCLNSELQLQNIVVDAGTF